MFKVIVCISIFGSFCFGQSHEQLMAYSAYYGQDIDAFGKFIKMEPSASQSISGIRQMVYELDGHNIGLEEHWSNNDKIGEIYVFQTNDNRDHAQSEWGKYLNSMEKDRSLTFVKAVFDDGIIRENNLTYDEFVSLLNSRNLNTNRSYGVRYKKQNAYFSLFIVKGKLVFTIDDKNY